MTILKEVRQFWDKICDYTQEDDEVAAHRDMYRDMKEMFSAVKKAQQEENIEEADVSQSRPRPRFTMGNFATTTASNPGWVVTNSSQFRAYVPVEWADASTTVSYYSVGSQTQYIPPETTPGSLFPKKSEKIDGKKIIHISSTTRVTFPEDCSSISIEDDGGNEVCFWSDEDFGSMPSTVIETLRESICVASGLMVSNGGATGAYANIERQETKSKLQTTVTFRNGNWIELRRSLSSENPYGRIKIRENNKTTVITIDDCADRPREGISKILGFFFDNMAEE
jgi:hypothetical protein